MPAFTYIPVKKTVSGRYKQHEEGPDGPLQVVLFVFAKHRVKRTKNQPQIEGICVYVEG